MLRAELRKLLPYRTAWVILVLYAVLLAIFVSVGGNVVINGQRVGQTLYAFPAVWSKLSYAASYFNMLLSILLIILITDEFQFRTFRQQVINGASQLDLIQGKMAVSALLTLFGTTAVLIIGFYFGLTRAPETAASATTNLSAVALYAVQALGYLALAALLAFLIRRSGAAILLFLLYSWVVEPLIRFSLPDELDRFFPMKILASLTPTPGQEMLDTVTGPNGSFTATEALPFAIGYIGLFWLLSYALLRNRDL
ncbi:ABC transporter permease [Hymenobacter sp. BT491]|uniref:ABC transporter permease n=1 Tax=Hymenobacter sp. BT491 TaxID=2766779 RepID=UPI001653BD74|nr:ABC transporter permease [Hymenobacter sp. BT491]MBC6990156.1 ABC transporter permease [Hymenobacter sp. BT491]